MIFARGLLLILKPLSWSKAGNRWTQKGQTDGTTTGGAEGDRFQDNRRPAGRGVHGRSKGGQQGFARASGLCEASVGPYGCLLCDPPGDPCDIGRVWLAAQVQPLQAQAAEDAPQFARPAQPSLNFYGAPGIIDLPSGEALPEGQFTTTYSWFGGTSRYNLTFQALPWLSASFRYNGIQNLNLFGFNTYYDRGFDVRFRLLRERKFLPALTLGLQDFSGTGIYAAEYIAATKTFDTPALSPGSLPGRLKLTAGLGWGRLGSSGTIGTIGTRGRFDGGDTGGELSIDQWFRGDVAPFAGLEWELDERWGIKAEYSSDAYDLETRQSDVFERRSSFNFGVEFQKNPGLRLGAYYLYGSELGVHRPVPAEPQTSGDPAAHPIAGAGGTAQPMGHRAVALDHRLDRQQPETGADPRSGGRGAEGRRAGAGSD